MLLRPPNDDEDGRVGTVPDSLRRAVIYTNFHWILTLHDGIVYRDELLISHPPVDATVIIAGPHR